MAVAAKPVHVGAITETPYKLDPDQTLKASRALLKHIKSETEKLQQSSTKKNLLATEDSDDEEDVSNDVSQSIWLNLATKQHIVDRTKLKPSKIPVPNSLNASADLTICLITTDPQRAVKNAVADATFPVDLSTRITKIIGISKLQARYKSFESRRQLLSEHDIFLADDRIITRLPASLGKIFYKGTAKRPIPISIAPRKTAEAKQVKKTPRKKGESAESEVASPTVIAAEIQRAVDCVPISLRPGLNVAVRIGLPTFTAEQIAQNVTAVVPALIEKHVVKGWRNVKSVMIKSATSAALPIWLSDELWADDEKVVETPEGDMKLISSDTTAEKKRKRNPTTTKGPQAGQNKKPKKEEEKANGEQRKQRLAAQKAKTFETGL